MEQQGPNHIRNSLDDMLSFTILRRDVGIREKKANAMSGKVVVELTIVKLAAIVTLKAFYVDLELGLHKFMKLSK